MSELMKKLRCLEDKVRLQQKDIDTLDGMCQTAHKRITLQDNRITELETTNVAVQEVAVQKTTTVEVMEPPKKRQRKKASERAVQQEVQDEDGQGNHKSGYYATDMQGNTVPRTKIWHHARKIALDDILATGCKRDELGTYCAKNRPLNGLWYKATMETFQKLIERSRQQCWTEAILSQASQRVPVSNARDWNRCHYRAVPQDIQIIQWHTKETKQHTTNNNEKKHNNNGKSDCCCP